MNDILIPHECEGTSDACTGRAEVWVEQNPDRMIPMCRNCADAYERWQDDSSDETDQLLRELFGE